MLARISAVTAVLAFPLVIWAQPLADRVPADAVVYVAWQGSESLPPSYQQSHLKAVLDASNIPQFFSEFMPQVAQKLSQQEPQAGAIAEMLLAIGGPLWRHPCALSFAGIDFNAPGGPRPKLAILCEAGADADALLGQFQPLVGMAQGTPFPVRTGKAGNLVVLSVGYDQEADSVAKAPASAISANAKFKAAMKQVQNQPIIVAYFDAEGIVATIDQAMKTSAPAPEQQQWTNTRQEMGLDSMKYAIFTGGFEGKDWETHAFLAAPAPRQGWLKTMEAKPLSDALLKAIPQSSTWAGAGQMDLGAMFDWMREMIANSDPRASKEFDQFIAQANQAMGMDLRKDFLGAFGSEWAIYIDPQTGGSGITGLTLVNRLGNEASAGKGLTKLEEMANQMIAREMEAPFQVTISQRQIGKLDVHTLGVPFVAPSWTIKDGVLYAGLYPQQVVAAAEGATGRPGIMENQQFMALRKKLGAEKADSFSYADLQQTAPGMYQLALPLTQAGLGFAEILGVRPPALVLPPMSRLQGHLGPAATFSWMDETGWHVRSHSPFPGSGLLGSDNSVVMGTTAMGVAILLPALNSAKERANRVKCASNLRQIGLGTMMYANDHNGKYPPDLGTLVAESDLNPQVFICPGGDSQVPGDIRAGKMEDTVRWVNEHADYVYLSGQMNAANPADRILAYEKPGNHDKEGINVLFNDGHVEWVVMPRARELIQKQTGREP